MRYFADGTRMYARPVLPGLACWKKKTTLSLIAVTRGRCSIEHIHA